MVRGTLLKNVHTAAGTASHAFCFCGLSNLSQAPQLPQNAPASSDSPMEEFIIVTLQSPVC